MVSERKARVGTTSLHTEDSRLVERAVDRGLIPPEVAITVTQRSLAGERAAEVLVRDGHLTRKLVERLMTDPASVTQVAPSTHATVFSADQLAIPGYTVLSLLGRGGMGAAYRATQDSLGRQVALKIISGELAKDPEFADRFLREARAAGAINHPNVIACIDVGRAGEVLFMALELASGGDAAAMMRAHSGRLSEEKTVAIGIDCCRGLSAIARAGLIHRDIKPSNIFFAEDGSAKLADLGLARSTDGDDRMTVTGRAMGTPAFMSPEQARGDRDIGIASDICALGATLFCMATGEAPYDGPTAWVVVAKVMNDDVPDPRAFVPGLSPGFAAVVMRAMAKDPAARYPSPEAMLGDLECLAAGLSPSVAAPPSSIDGQDNGGAAEAASQPTADRRQRRWVLPTAAGLAALTGTAIAWAFFGSPRSDLPPPRPEIARPGPAATTAPPIAIPVISISAGDRERADALALRLVEARQASATVAALPGGGLAVAGLDSGFQQLDLLLGQPIRRLSLAGTRVSDLSPLAGLPLEELDCSRTRIESLTPLARMPLRRLVLRDATRITSLAPLAALPLEALDLRGCSGLTSLGGIETLRLRELDLSGCTGLRGDLMALSALPLTRLSLAGCSRVRALDGIETVPLTALDLTGCTGLTSLAPLARCAALADLVLDGTSGLPLADTLAVLRRMPALRQLSLADCDWVSGLQPLADLRLTRLSLAGLSAIEDLAPLRGMPLAELDLSRLNRLRSLAPIEDAPLTRLVITGASGLDASALAGLRERRGQQLVIIR